jgi:hypothetical protein
MVAGPASPGYRIRLTGQLVPNMALTNGRAEDARDDPVQSADCARVPAESTSAITAVNYERTRSHIRGQLSRLPDGLTLPSGWCGSEGVLAMNLQHYGDDRVNQDDHQRRNTRLMRIF